MRSVTLLSLLGGAAVLAVTLTSHAHPDHGGKDQHHDHDAAPTEVSETMKKKRLERVIRQAERKQRNIAQRTKDRRRHLKRRLGRHLKDGNVTAEMTSVLKQHAERTAMLRQIRYVAAKENDYDTVIAADKVLAQQNTNHEVWWRTVIRAARKK